MSTTPRILASLVALAALVPATQAETIQWNPTRGSARAVSFTEQEAPRFDGSAVSVAHQFLSRNRHLFNGQAATRQAGIDSGRPFVGIAAAQPRDDEGQAPHITVSRVDHGQDVTYVRMQQVKDGLEVVGGDVVVAVRAGGQVSAVQGGYVASAHQPAPFGMIQSVRISEDRALEVARGELAARFEGLELTDFQRAKLVWWTDPNGKLVKAFQVDVMSAAPRGDWRFHVDAVSGRVLSRANHLIFSAEATGQGQVYMSNPLRDDTLQPVTLAHLDGSGSLSGSYVRIKNGKHDPIHAPDGNFVVEPDSTHFAEVSGYYHMNRIHDHLKQIDPAFSGMDWQVPFEVHGKGSFWSQWDNAYYSPWAKSITILDPQKLNDLHLEAAVTYHEYHHAVTANIVPGLSNTWGKSLHEGFSDYFACVLTGDPQVGEWALKPINKPHMRDLTSDRRYPEDCHPDHEPHSDGEIWGAVCWSLRQKIGAPAHFLAHKSRFYLSTAATFESAYEAILAADRDHLGGAHQEAITAVFTERGIAGSQGAEDVVSLRQRLSFENLFGILR